MMPTFLNQVTIGQVTVLVTILGAVIAFLRKVLPWMRNISHFVDDVSGQAPRNGRPASPGLLERQAAVEASIEDIRVLAQQLRPNGGGSVKDQLNRIDALALRVNDQLNDLRATTRALQMTYDSHAHHASQAELELRSALAELQHRAFRE